jgi:hypothetical protein
MAHAMTDQSFLRRWARRKSESRETAPSVPDAAPESRPAAPAVDSADAVPAAPPATGAAPAPLPPTLEDVARLTPDADFSSFVARGVDPAVRRGALKKLFADPHFHAIDGLDVYIGDYTKPSPVSEAMLASLDQARRLLARALDDGTDDARAKTTGNPEDETS